MNAQISRLLSELEKVSDEAQKNFGNLSGEQIKWKPGGG